nr:MAG TPA_asm: hypothetical protein [Bacteriophage sp.]
MIYNFGDKLECYSSSGKTVCTISTDGINFEGLDWGDYDYIFDNSYYLADNDSVTLETSGITCNGKTIRSYIDSLDSQFYIDERLREMFKNKEEKEMNKVLELYYERRIKKLGEFYKELKEQKYNELEVVKEFNEVVEEYNNKMQELMGKYREEDENMSLIHKTGYNEYPYVLSHAVKDDIVQSLGKSYEENKKALLEEKETIAAILSLSEDKDYQVEVLKNYGILDKKGMMVEDDE